MARSFSNTKLAISALIDGVSLSINRSRGFASMATQAVGSSTSSVVVKGGKSGGGEEIKRPSSSSVKEVTPWVPDPITGYYRPENNRSDEMDVAELRDMLINHKNNDHH